MKFELWQNKISLYDVYEFSDLIHQKNKGDFITMKEKYEDRQKQKVIAITTDTLVVGVDIAKNYQWAKFVDFRGIEHDRALKTAKAALRLS